MPTLVVVERMALDEVTTEVDEVSGRLAQAFRESRNDAGAIDVSTIEILEGDDASKGQQLREMNERLNKLVKRRDDLTQFEEIAAAAERELALKDKPKGLAPFAIDGPKGPAPKMLRPLSKRITDEAVAGETSVLDVTPEEIKALLQSDQKTVMSTGAGWAPESIRTPGSTLAGREERYVQDFIPIVPITQAAYVFMEQTTRTPAAAETVESVQGTLTSLPEAAFAWTERTETLRKIGHFIPVTKEQLADVVGLQAELDAEMIAGIRERLSSQIIAGDGSAPNIEGFLDAGRSGVNTQAAGSDDRFTAIHNGMTTNRVTGQANVDMIIMHDNDWHQYRTAQTSDGTFIMGPPNAVVDKMLFGIPVLVTTHETENTALLGDFARFARIPVIGSIVVESSSEHASFFIQGVLAIKAELRATLAVLRESAFTKVTGL